MPSFIQPLPISKRIIRYLNFILLALTVNILPGVQSAHAIGADSDGIITPETQLLVIYHYHQSMHQSRDNGDLTSSNAQLRGDLTIFRYLYPFQLTENIIWSPNLLLPYSNMRSGGDIAQLGSNRGFGDLTLVSGFWFYNEKRHFLIAPFLSSR